MTNLQKFVKTSKNTTKNTGKRPKNDQKPTQTQLEVESSQHKRRWPRSIARFHTDLRALGDVLSGSDGENGGNQLSS